VQQYPAIVARELGEVSTDGQDHPLRTPPVWGATETGQTTASYGLKFPSGQVTMRFLADLAKLVVAWPLYATYHAIALANTYQGFRAKAVTFLTFLPALVATTAIWAMLWAFVLWLVTRG